MVERVVKNRRFVSSARETAETSGITEVRPGRLFDLRVGFAPRFAGAQQIDRRTKLAGCCESGGILGHAPRSARSCPGGPVRRPPEFSLFKIRLAWSGWQLTLARRCDDNAPERQPRLRPAGTSTEDEPAFAPNARVASDSYRAEHLRPGFPTVTFFAR